MSKRIGIVDVAAAAGVSATTVSHALSGQGKMAPETRERVARVAAELGYAPNRIASALRRQRSSIIGFVSDEVATSPFSGGIVLGAQDAAAERGALLMVVTSNRDTTIEAQQLDALVAQQVDAVIYARVSNKIVDAPPQLTRQPTVLVDAYDPNSALDSVIPDERQIGRLATDRLLAAGHRVIVHLTVDETGPAARGRIDGYLDACAEAGIRARVIRMPGQGDARAGREALDRALAAYPDLTAAFAFNDPMAMGIYQAAMERGIEIPHALSVVSVDNLELIASQLRPALTTVRLPHYEMGRMAVGRLFQLLEGGMRIGDRHVKLACELVERESVGSVGSPAIVTIP
ncbi:MAG: LacI family DNA-binding transcriptional regulator [Gordonia polyisoprenivorans]|nr:LacI family DNA-binding transcriptional regulator [Gordonia polyisoprenivorans]